MCKTNKGLRFTDRSCCGLIARPTILCHVEPPSQRRKWNNKKVVHQSRACCKRNRHFHFQLLKRTLAFWRTLFHWCCIYLSCAYFFFQAGQTDLSFRWAHMSFRWFCHGVAHVLFYPTEVIITVDSKKLAPEPYWTSNLYDTSTIDRIRYM